VKTVTVPNMLWFENQPKTLEFPDRWDVEVLEAPGLARDKLDEEGLRRAIESPIGSPTLAELAGDASEVAIVFDDLTRPTPVRDLLPFILPVLSDAGIPDRNVRFIPALGMHGAMNMAEFRKKLGEDTVRRYAVYNPNPYENCEDLGKSPSGIPVLINREFMACDLRIGIGCISPHVHVGFGGGGKIILPGICGFETIRAFHAEVAARGYETLGLGNFDGNVMYKEIVDVTRMSGLQFKVDALINDRGQVTDLYAGDPIEAHLAGVAEAREHYATRPVSGKDIVVVNAYGKYNEMGISMMMALACADFETPGTVVLVVDAPEGQVCHYLMRSFGKDYGGACYIQRGPAPGGIKGILCSAYPDRTMTDLFVDVDTVALADDWSRTLELLEEAYPGEASVAVIPDATMQYFRG
jgi:lactate racemase